MKKSYEKYQIKKVRAMLTSEGKVFPMKSTKYPYEELKSLNKENRVWIVRHKKSRELFVAKYQTVKELSFLSSYFW